MPQSPLDRGFTLVELLVTITLLGGMMTIAISGWAGWARASEQSGTARELQSAMRQAHQRAVTDGRAMCVQFDTDDDTYTVFRGACDDTARTKLLGPFETGSARVRISTPSFTGSSEPAGATFYARGTATPGSVKVTLDGSTKTYTLRVDGLTGRVSLS